MNILLRLFKTLYKLGLFNVIYVIWYRASIFTGIRKYIFPKTIFTIDNDIFKPADPSSVILHDSNPSIIQEADELLEGNVNYYMRHTKNIGSPPNWFLNPFSGMQYKHIDKHWTSLPDFDPTFGDIKNIWELSRFAWLTTLARAHAVSGEKVYLDLMNHWLSDWIEKNPINQGPHWKCGQEASIRVFNLMNASLILHMVAKPPEPLTDFIYLHLGRISSNIRYAIAQNNNHGTSEAAALFMGGSWLLSIDPKRYSLADKYSIKGRKWLENRLEMLVSKDGGFSQYSTNYHRVLLDTMIFVEVWRRKLSLNKFTEHFYTKVRSAIDWLDIFVDPISGDAPNLGANDGALLLTLHSCGYRDFRPTIQTGHSLFKHSMRYASGNWDEPHSWLDIQVPECSPERSENDSKLLESGFVYLRGIKSWCMIRYPQFKFRPSHNDVFHFDLWHKGQNIVFDSGTYTYAQSVSELKLNLKSVHFHNTVSFDGSEQMQELSRFLLGGWLKPDFIADIVGDKYKQSWEGQYTTADGNKHHRKVSIEQDVWLVEDDLQGSFSFAIIGFNIVLGEYNLQGNIIVTAWGNITIPENTKFKIVPSTSSWYYREKQKVNRLEIMVNGEGLYKTKFELTA